MKILFLFLNVILWNCDKNSQAIKKSNNERYFQNSKKDESITLKDSSNIFKYLPVNYSVNGDADYTKELQRAFDENKNIIMPNFPIAVNYKGVNIPNNRIITFQKKSSLIVLPNNQSTYQAFLVSNAQNVKIINPNLIGERDQHIGNTGEWGMGIKIISSNNVDIINPNIKNFWGDAIYIGRIENGISYCYKIKVSGGTLDNNRRNGISIISGKDITIENVTIKNTNGISPMAGIDLEPNLQDEYLYNINLNNISTINNKLDGIKIVFDKLINSNKFLININGHSDMGSQNPLTIVGYNQDNITTAGIVNYSNAKWNTNKDVKFQRKLNQAIQLNIQKVNIDGRYYNKNIKSKSL